MTVDAASTGHAFSLTLGGPVYRLEKRLHLDPPTFARRLVAMSIALFWFFPVVLALLELPFRRFSAGASVLGHLGFHARGLFGVPLLILADLVLERRVVAVTALLVESGVVTDAEHARWHRLLARVERWRDKAVAELVPIVLVAAFAVLEIGALAPSGVVSWLLPVFYGADASARFSPAWWWYVAVVQPLFLFFVLRWLWHWFLWAYVLVSLSRMKLDLQSSHPDRAGGIGYLAAPIDSADLAAFAVSAVLTCTWADQVVAHGATPALFAPWFIALVIVFIVLPLLPYLSLTLQLQAARRTGIGSYGGFARDYIKRFDAAWVTPPGPRTQLGLGLADVQSLADTGTAFRVVDEMRSTVFSTSRVLRLFAFTVVPVLVLVAANMPAVEIARRLFGVIF